MVLGTRCANIGEIFMEKILIGVIVIMIVIGGAGVYVFLNAGKMMDAAKGAMKGTEENA